MQTRSSNTLTALAAGLTLAAMPVTAAPPAHPVNYSAGAALWLNQNHQAQFSQGVTLKQDDETLQTDAAVVNFDDEQNALNADSRAPVHLWDTQDDITGQHGTIDFHTHIATIENNITVLVKPGPQEKNAPKTSLHSRFTDPATMTCQLMTYDYHKKFGTVPGPLTIHQKDRTLTADSGTYDARTQIVTLIGHVHGHNGDGLVDAPAATIGVREGEEFVRIDQKVTGVLTPKNDDDTDDTTDSNAPVDDKNGYDAIMNGGPTAPATDNGSATPPASPPAAGGSVRSAQPAAPPATPPDSAQPAPATPAKPTTPAASP